ncbi:MAG: P1 family peptidase [Bacillota bacterium]|jgi:D-aminopeptidase
MMANTVEGPRRRSRELGIVVGILEPGRLNSITDVPGVSVGHCTLVEGDGRLIPGSGSVRTGVTAVVPHPGNLFREKVPAAIHVINGFGKATGLAQVMELGNIETPIVLTNTLSVGTAWDALCEFMLHENPDIGVTTGTVNPVVGECNDGYLNDIRGRHVKHEHVFQALRSARTGSVEEGSIGAGTGMSCLGFKGGIGTASRKLAGEISRCHLGVLVLSNFGSLQDLTVLGVPVGREFAGKRQAAPTPPGSVIVVMATDAPLSSRQIQRVARRCQAGLARTGSTFSNGSGDFVIGFSTENRIAHSGPTLGSSVFLRDDSQEMAALFRAAAEATEEAVYNSLFAARTMVGRDGNMRLGLSGDEVVRVLRTHGIV